MQEHNAMRPHGPETTAQLGTTCGFPFPSCLIWECRAIRSLETTSAGSLEAQLLNYSHDGWSWEFSIPSIAITPPKAAVIVNPGSMAQNMKQSVAATLRLDRKSTRLNSSHGYISYAV